MGESGVVPIAHTHIQCDLPVFKHMKYVVPEILDLYVVAHIIGSLVVQHRKVHGSVDDEVEHVVENPEKE